MSADKHNQATPALAVAPCSAPFYRKHAYVQGVRNRDLEKLSPAMWELLWEANAFGGRAPYDTTRLSTRRALAGKGLLDGWQLTTLGRRALLVEWREPNNRGVADAPLPDPRTTETDSGASCH